MMWQTLQCFSSGNRITVVTLTTGNAKRNRVDKNVQSTLGFVENEITVFRVRITFEYTVNLKLNKPVHVVCMHMYCDCDVHCPNSRRSFSLDDGTSESKRLSDQRPWLITWSNCTCGNSEIFITLTSSVRARVFPKTLTISANSRSNLWCT